MFIESNENLFGGRFLFVIDFLFYHQRNKNEKISVKLTDDEVFKVVTFDLLQ